MFRLYYFTKMKPKNGLGNIISLTLPLGQIFARRPLGVALYFLTFYEEF